MRTQQFTYLDQGWRTPLPDTANLNVQLLLCFGRSRYLFETHALTDLKRCFPHARIVGCSTAGEIAGTSVLDESLVVTALQLEKTELEFAAIDIDSADRSRAAGEALANQLKRADLRHVLVLSDGLNVNGSELVAGLTSALPSTVSLTGGLAVDYSDFASTQAWLDRPFNTPCVVGVGFYGSHIRIGHGSLGGWDSFGPDRVITRSKGNVLYEMDGKSALALYKDYLGDYAKDLPASGLLFPLALNQNGDDQGPVRTLLGIDEDEQSMTFAGDMPEGISARLMKANFDRLIEGAENAALQTQIGVNGEPAPDFALLISCVGRKMVLKQRVEDETEAVRDILGNATCYAGFYSYGEISPLKDDVKCVLHNQTMTITTFTETL